MGFEEAYEGWNAERLTQSETAQLLGMCERSFRRYVSRYEAEGRDGLIDRRLEQVSNRRAPVDEVMALSERNRTRRASPTWRPPTATCRRSICRRSTPSFVQPAMQQGAAFVPWIEPATQWNVVFCMPS